MQEARVYRVVVLITIIHNNLMLYTGVPSLLQVNHANTDHDYLTSRSPERARCKIYIFGYINTL